MAVRRSPGRNRTVVQYGLNKITLNNFRSIKSQEISIKPLTIVVGGNSAGKSSLLKAVLLMAQAQREKNIPGEVALNGAWVRLEQFKSVVHGGDVSSDIRIGLNFLVTSERRSVTRDLVSPSSTSISPNLLSFSVDERQHELSYEIEIGATDRNRGVAFVKHCVLARPEFGLDIRRAEIDDLSAGDTSGSLPFSGDFEYHQRDDFDNSRGVTGAFLSGAIVTQCVIERPMIEAVVDAMVSHGKGLNRFHMKQYSDTARRIQGRNEDAQKYLDELYESENSPSSSRFNGWTSEVVPQLVVNELIGRELEFHGAQQTLAEIQEYGAQAWSYELARNISRNAVHVFLSVLSDRDRYPHLSELLIKAVENPIESEVKIAADLSDPMTLLYRVMWNAFSYLETDNLTAHFEDLDPVWKTSVSVISDDYEVIGAEHLDLYLSRSVHYLGPLRVAPSSATDYSRRGSDRGVGPEGQHLAYQLMMNPIVSGFKWADSSEDRRDLSVESIEVTLASAMSYWVNQLNLATSVRAEEIPGVGDSIKLQVTGMRSELSPNDVGVGVSQALPVIGAVLLANPGDLVVLEQPELHLHPDAQLELAEFFVAAMKSGRRLLIESHSEHFLNKLRLMAAKADEDVAKELTEMVGFVFAERGSEDGLSHFREVRLTSDGSVQDWPNGFFDQGANAAKDLFLLRQKRLKS